MVTIVELLAHRKHNRSQLKNRWKSIKSSQFRNHELYVITSVHWEYFLLLILHANTALLSLILFLLLTL